MSGSRTSGPTLAIAAAGGAPPTNPSTNIPTPNNTNNGTVHTNNDYVS